MGGPLDRNTNQSNPRFSFFPAENAIKARKEIAEYLSQAKIERAKIRVR